jgi:hypothetical protein
MKRFPIRSFYGQFGYRSLNVNNIDNNKKNEKARAKGISNLEHG